MPPACFLNAPTPLPLIPTPSSALVSTVENVSGSDARGTDDSSYAATTVISCDRAVKGHKFTM